METIIRNAKKEDMPRVLELIQELADFEKESDAVAVTLAELEAAGFSNPPSFVCFVAEVAHTIEGIALCYFRFSTWKGKTVHLEDLIVTQKMRGKGLGTLLYQRVLQFAKQEGVRRVNWEVIDWNTPAIEFYERTGARILKDWHVVEMSKTAYLEYLNT